MKRIHTQSREANRASEYHKTGGYRLRSKNRSLLRDKPKPKTFGEPIHYLQPVFKGFSRLGNPRFIFIPHAFN